jgi:hypothetical protein
MASHADVQRNRALRELRWLEKMKPPSPHPRNGKAPLVLGEYLTEEELAKELRLDPRTLRGWRAQGEGPPVSLGSDDGRFSISLVSAHGWRHTNARCRANEADDDQVFQ